MSDAAADPRLGTARRPSPLRAVQPRALRRQPRRRRLLRSACFGDVATEVCIRTDGDEGLFASYSDVQFRAPVRAGDVLEIEAEVVRVGTRSRTLDLEVRVVARGRPDRSPSAAEVLEPPVVATTATGTVVVPPRS